MDQSTAVKRPLESSINGQGSNNVISLSAIRKHQRAARRHRNNMIKQRLMGLGLFLVGLLVWLMIRDLTVTIFLAPFYGMMMFYPKYIMKFNTKR